MSWGQRAAVIALIVVAVAIWGLSLRSVVLPGAQADQESAEGTAVAEVPTGVIDGTPPPLATLTSLSKTVPTTPTRTRTPLLSPAAIQPALTPWAAETSTRLPSPTATAARSPADTPSPTVTPAQVTIPTPLSEPFPTPVIPESGRFLLVNQDEQVMRVYEAGVEIRTIPVSTGKPVANGFTPPWRGNVGRDWGSGPFLNSDLWSDYMWYLFPGARGSILIHSVPYTRAGEVKIYDRLDALGVEPASHGCVRISPEDAEWLKVWDPVGVPIEITPWSGEIGPPDESLWTDGSLPR